MKQFFAALSAFAFLPLLSARAVLFSWNVNQEILDNDPNGVVSIQSVSLPFDSIGDLRVTLQTEGGWAGDLYVYLQHDSGFSVLLNRPGRTAADPFGFAGGLSITLADSAATDVHLGPGVLSGTFQPDGRETDPSCVLDTDSRTAYLSDFIGANPNGEWSLYIADLSAGDKTRLVGWGLDISPSSTSVPDGGTTFSMLGAAVGALALWRRLSRRRHGS